jgi:hypothetical protein
MGLIFIPKLTKKYLLFLGFTISAFLRDYISLINFNDYLEKGKINAKFKEQPIQKRHFDIITNIISDSLQGIFVFFNRMKIRKESKKSVNQSFLNSDDKLSSIKETKNTSTCLSFMKIMIKIVSVDYFCQLLFLIFSLIFKKDEIIPRKNNNYLLIIDILSRFIFCRLILDTYFYKHHIVSMIINLVVFIILGLFDIYNIFKQVDMEISIFFSFLIIQTIAYSMEDVLNKIALSRESLTPYSLLYYKGIMEIPFLIITTIIVLYFQNTFNDFSLLDPEYQKYVLVRRSLFIILNILRSIFLVKVIDKFSSQHLSILKVLESIFMFVYFLIHHDYKDNIIYIPIISVSFIIIVFTSLVYNEIIVINICGLQDYTQHGLDIQADKDLREAITEISEMSEDVSQTTSRSESIVVRSVSYND